MKKTLLQFYIIFALLLSTLNMVAQTSPGDTAGGGWGAPLLEGDDDPDPIDQTPLPVDDFIPFLALAGISLAFYSYKKYSNPAH